MTQLAHSPQAGHPSSADRGGTSGANAQRPNTLGRKAFTLFKFLVALYAFFLCIELFGASFKLFGRDAATSMLAVTANPVVGLVLGVLATSLVQSSSTTTSVLVGLVATGALPVGAAIPMVMGANIGTTVTNTIVSMGHVRRREEFRNAFAGATVHDFFNLCAVAVLLPIEVFFHPIQRAAEGLSVLLVGGFGGATFTSPLKAIVKPVSKAIESLGLTIIANEVVLGVVLAVLALAFLMVALAAMVRIMRRAIAGRMRNAIDRVLFGGKVRAVGVGAGLTAVVQSSSVTTSLAVPLIGAGVVSVERAFPFMVGANIGTTVTAMLASFVTGESAAVTLAFCHLLFNIVAMLIFLPLAKIPITMARGLGNMVSKHRWSGPLYVLVVFFGVPGLFILFT